MKFSRFCLLFFLCLSVFATYLQFERLKTQEVDEINYLTSLYKERLKNEINRTVLATNMLKQVVLFYDGNIPEGELPLFSQLVYSKDRHVSINFLPNGILSYSYPMELNAAAIGYNVFENPLTKKDALLTKDLKQITLSGPYIQHIPSIDTPGEFYDVPVIVARNPIYLTKDGQEYFWGFISIDISPSKEMLAQVGLKDNAEFPYEYKIDSVYNGNTVNLAKTTNFNQDRVFTTHDFLIGSSEWTFSLYRKELNTDQFVYTILVAITFVGISFALFSLIRFFEVKLNKTQALALIDQLTNIKNRKAVELYAEQVKNGNIDTYTIFYIDLNKFKPVNDTYGHKIGDLLLSRFASRLVGNFSYDTFLARIGGDEFIVIISENLSDDVCKSIRNRIILIAETAFYIDNIEINISASVGYANYPNDAASFDKVLERADKAMYSHKSTDNEEEKKVQNI